MKAANDKNILGIIENAKFIISSSPPESSHLLAYKLAKKINTKFIIDLRDGWLDEPLKIVLNVPLRKYFEEKIEKKVLSGSSRIFVTSEKWKELLINRIPKLGQKVTVLTNGYPPANDTDNSTEESSPRILLIHSGRFKAGRRTHYIRLLIEPLHYYLRQYSSSGKILLLGDLRPDEINEVESWQKKFIQFNWELCSKKSVSRLEMLKMLQKADGLLLPFRFHRPNTKQNI